MAARTLKTLGTFIARSGNNVAKSSSITIANTLFSRKPKVLLNFQSNAAYRAAVLHEIAKPLAIEDVVAIAKLKDEEVLFKMA